MMVDPKQYIETIPTMAMVVVSFWVHFKRGSASEANEGAVARSNKTGKTVLRIANGRQTTACGGIRPTNPLLYLRVDRFAYPLSICGHGAVANVKCLTHSVHTPAIPIRDKAGERDKQLEVDRALLRGTQY